MNEYRHHVSGFFADREAAERTRSQLIEQGLPAENVEVHSSRPQPEPPAAVRSNEVLKAVIVDGAIGAAVGTGIGVLAQVALIAANVSLFVASPLVAPLALLGWGASLGGFIGAASGAGDREGDFSDLVRDAIASGQVVLVAKTRGEEESVTARAVIGAAVGEYDEAITA